MFKGLVLAAQFALIIGSAEAFAAAARVKIAELAAHRVGRLVDLGDAEANYVTRFHKIEVTALAKNGVNDPAFKVTASQVPPHHGSAHKIEIYMSDTGKVIGIPQEARGQDSANAPVWPSADALTLVEAALHYVFDSRDANLQNFKNGTATVELNQVMDNTGAKIAQVTFTSVSTDKILEVDLSLDAKVTTFRVVNP